MLSYNPDEFSEIHQTLSKSFALQRKTLVRVLGLEKRVAKLEKPNTDRSRKEKLKYMVSGDIDGKNYAETEKTINAEIDSQGAFKKFIQPDDIKPETLDEGDSAIDKMRSLANALQSNFNNAIARLTRISSLIDTFKVLMYSQASSLFLISCIIVIILLAFSSSLIPLSIIPL